MLYDFLSKRGVSVALGTSIVLSIIAFVLMAVGMSDVPADSKPAESYGKTCFDFGLYLTYFLFFVVVIAALVMLLIKNPKQFGIMAAVVVVLIIFIKVLGGNSYDAGQLMKMNISESISSSVDGSLKFFYILFFASIGAIFGMEGYRMVKKD
jgi:predicted lysophospholipase L1 biosynthesis ABC-type transport system permease subunit